jgi:hypothetical protein
MEAMGGTRIIQEVHDMNQTLSAQYLIFGQVDISLVRARYPHDNG